MNHPALPMNPEYLAAIALLQSLGDPREQLSLLADFQPKLPPFPAEARTDANRIHQCATPVWLHTTLINNALHATVDSSSPIVRGLARLTALAFHLQTPESITAAPPLDYLKQTGLIHHLSPTRQNGLLHLEAAFRQRTRHPYP
jgi:sulfur transfer protein SufE